MAANAEERTSQLESLSGLVVRVSMKPVSTMQIGSGQNGHCGKGSAIDFVADAKVEAYAPPRSRDDNKKGTRLQIKKISIKRAANEQRRSTRLKLR